MIKEDLSPTTIRSILKNTLQKFPGKSVFRLKDTQNNFFDITIDRFNQEVENFGTALLDLSLENKFISVISENRYEWCLTYMSTICGVGTIVPLDKELPENELINLISRSNSSCVVFSEKYLSVFLALKQKLPNLKYLINMDSSEHNGDVLSFSKLILDGQNKVLAGDKRFSNLQIDENALSALIFTSGTTAESKGVMLSNKNLASNVVAMSKMVNITSDDLIISILPLHHTYECTTSFLTVLYNGGTIAFNEGLKYIAKNILEYRPTILILVPLIVENIYKKVHQKLTGNMVSKIIFKTALTLSNIARKVFGVDLRRKIFSKLHEQFGGRLKMLIVGAAAMDPLVINNFEAMGLKILQGYGLTEASPVVSVNPEFNNRPGSIGKVLPNLDVRIDNPSSDGIGEIIVAGDSVMLGYFQNDEATLETLRNGFLYTGDLGYIDNDGFLYITGRKKNVIVTKNGKNIFPEEIETKLNQSPYILESLVSGISLSDDDDIYVFAQIVPDYEEILLTLKIEKDNEKAIYSLISDEIKKLNRTLTLYKNVRKFNIRETEFVKTTTKKIKRNGANS